MVVDFIIVGQGLSGTCFAFELLRRRKSFIILDKFRANSSSQVALGVYNPIILKWFTKPWNVDPQIDFFYSFYSHFGKLLNEDLFADSGIYKFLPTPGDQTNWLTKSNSIHKSQYMSSNLFDIDNVNLVNANNYGYINKSGKLHVQRLLKLFRSYCVNHSLMKDEFFSYDDLKFDNSKFKYNNIVSNNLIFCEGKSAVNNPFFPSLNFKFNKGELITIHSSELDINKIIHSGFLLVPLGHNLYSFGSTYNDNFKNDLPSKIALEKLKYSLKKVIKSKYKIISHRAAIRPSTLDRRPLIGSHFKYSNMYILNGLGTRGVLLAPYMSNCLLNSIYSNTLIDSEININRIRKAPLKGGFSYSK